MGQSGYDEISIYDIAHVLKKRWKFIMFPGIAGAIIVFGIVSLTPRAYEAYALLKVGTIGTQPLESIETTAQIMKTQPVIKEIYQGINDKDSLATEKMLKDCVKYESRGGLMEIRATAASPDKASRIVDVAVQIVLQRHQTLFNRAQERLDNSVKYLDEKARALTVWGSINEFGIEPTRMEIATVSSTIPVKSKRKVVTIVSFMIILFVNTLLAFYLEGKEK